MILLKENYIAPSSYYSLVNIDKNITNLLTKSQLNSEP